MSSFNEVIPWHVLKRHLQHELSAIDSELRHADGMKDIHNLQGEAKVLEALLNLPEILQALEEEEDGIKK